MVVRHDIIFQVIVLSTIMVIGIYSRKKEIITSEINKGLSEFLVSVTLPLLIFSSFNFKLTPKIIHNAELIFLYSLVIHIVLALLSIVFSIKNKHDKKKIIKFVMVFSNCAFIGYPVMKALYGQTGVFYTAIYGIPFNLIMFSIGVMFFKKASMVSSMKTAVIYPGTIATVLGLLLNIFAIHIPMPIFKGINLVGSMTTPLSMIIVGCMLAEVKIKDVFLGFDVYYATFLRLILAPFITFLILKLLRADRLMIQMCVVLESMPSAVLVSVFAEKYNGDSVLASKCVFISTILSIITIPLVVTFI